MWATSNRRRRHGGRRVGGGTNQYLVTGRAVGQTGGMTDRGEPETGKEGSRGPAVVLLLLLLSYTVRGMGRRRTNR